MHQQFGKFLIFLILCQNTRSFDDTIPAKCVKQELYSEEDELKTFHICLMDNTTDHICDKAKLPFEKWFHNVVIHKSCCERDNGTLSTKNKTQISKCDPTWQDHSLLKYRYCNLSASARTPSSQNNGLVEPSYFQIIIWIMALLALVGNFIVFVRSWVSLKRSYSSMTGVQKVHHLMLANLALADFLMGIYLLGIAISAIKFSGPHGRLHFLNSMVHFCNFLGTLSLVSSQMSVTVLVLMTSFRLYSVLRPFKEIKVMSSVIAVAICWTLWITFAFIPLFDNERIRTLFEVVVFRSCSKEKWVTMFSYRNIRQLLDGFMDSVSISCSSLSNHSLQLSDSVHGRQTLAVAQHLRLLNEKPVFVSYYAQENMCTPNYFFDALSDSQYMGMTMLSYNLFSFLFLLVAYCIIWLKTSGNDCYMSCCSTTNVGYAERVRTQENRKLQWKVIVIIVSDFLCWIPTCVLALIYTRLIYDPQVPEICDARVGLTFPKAIFTTIVLPINSALNPILYSGAHLTIFSFVFRR